MAGRIRPCDCRLLDAVKRRIWSERYIGNFTPVRNGFFLQLSLDRGAWSEAAEGSPFSGLREARLGKLPMTKLKWFVVMSLALLMLRSGSLLAAPKPLTENDLRRLIKGGVYTTRIAALVEERGISFSPTRARLDALRLAGADERLRHIIAHARQMTSQPEVNVHPPHHRYQGPSQATPKIGTQPPSNTLEVHPPNVPLRSNATLSLKPRATVGMQPSGAPAVPDLAGTRITVQNWQQYRQYMPLGMVELFQGSHSWKMPADLEMDIGPTTHSNIPLRYRQATEAYSNNVQVIHLANGYNDLENYVAGAPFPKPEEPDKGYKLLADLWFAYIPHLIAGTPLNPLTICSETRHGFISCTRLSYLYRQLAYNTDVDVPTNEAKTSDYWYTEWASIEEPEELRYTTLLTLFPKDNQRPKEFFMFIPSLRRWIRSSLAAHCAPIKGTDYVQDDYRRIGFNGGLGAFDADFLRHQRILALTGDFAPMGGNFPANYYMPLGWPKPSWGKWQLRDADVVEVRPVWSERRSYCYGKRVIYEDSETRYALWEDGYDSNLRLWKTAWLAQRMVKASIYGEVPGGFASTAWDFKYDHMTNATSEGKGGQDVSVNYDVPGEFHDFNTYSTPEGLAEIMR
jgi:hypothetical protein